MATGLLVIEDEPLVNTYLSEKLEHEGYLVHSAFNGKEALKLAKNFDINLIITDIVMPIMDGVEFCRELRKLEQFEKTPIIASTSWANREDELRQFGVRHFIEKPYDVRDLKDLIESVLNPPQKLTEPKRVLAVGEMALNPKRVVEELQNDGWPIEFKFLEVNGSKEEVLRDVSAIRADLILVDHSICQINCAELVRDLSESAPYLPLVVYNENRFTQEHHVDDLDRQTIRGQVIHLEKLTKMNLALVVVKLLKNS